MLHKKFLLFFLFFLFSLKAFSAVFVVTSNADSGPGTLRDALTQAAANGNATTDYINFNLPDLSEAGRTIVVLSQLTISSNVTIDGTTQMGAKIGISDAKVILTIGSSGYQSSFVCFYGNNSTNVEIDGLYFSLIGASDTYGTAIFLKNTSNIIIGKAGKGNVFGRVDEGIELLLCNHITVSANFFGIDPDTSMPAYTPWSGNLAIYSSDDILIGGDNRADGNIFVASQAPRESLISGVDPQTQIATDIDKCVIKNNTMGYYAKVIGVLDDINIDNVQNLIITDNLINYGSAFLITKVSTQLLITGNQCNIDMVNPGKNSTANTPYELFNVKKAIIGGPNPGDANTVINPVYPGDGYEAINTYQCYDILIQRNSIGCKTARDVYVARESQVELPVISINSITNNLITGTATPGSEIEVFSDSECQLCEPTHYLGSVIAGADGSWGYSAMVNSLAYTASASINGRTSLFAKVGINIDKAVIKNPSCGNNNGSISGISVTNSTKIEWTDQTGKVISNSVDINNLSPGTYTFTAYLGQHCNVQSTPFKLVDTKPQIDDTFLRENQNQCGKNNGSITGLNFKNSADFTTQSLGWTDQSGQIVGNSLDLVNVSSGNYTFTIVTTDGCTVHYGPITIKNTTGPNIDQSNAAIQPTNCGQSAGSITNVAVTGTGTLKYAWLNSQQQTVGTSKDLLGQPAGIYKLEVMDDSQCGPVYTTDITIPETNGITMDEAKAASNVASCSKNNGSITGIIVTGATKYTWTDAAGHTIITVDPDFLNVAPGDYTLTASNTSGCSKTSRIYHVGQDPPTQFPVYAAAIVPACFGKNNGSVSVATDLLVSSARWIDGQGLPRGGSSAQLTDVPAGTYQFFVTDKNGCENLYNSYTVTTIPQLQILPGSEKIVDDQCTLHTGSITNIRVNGGTQPYTWSWLDGSNKIITSSPDLSGIGAGVYTLNVNDASGCGLVSASYIVQNQPENIPAPAVNNLQLCSAGDALLQVTDPSTSYSYRLYDSPTNTTPVDEAANGNFKITVKNNTTYYVSQVSGDCESPRSAVQVSVGITAVDIANAFTPNGDGINDYWVIKGIASYPSAIVQVFTRNGLKIFESKGYTTPFDGTFDGKKLPPGVYYYIINLKSNCNLLSGSLTIIR
ncbi:gliding motility-associated C-terminal domain-containing protein [Mucilaginibacter sp.]|uniref:gliding motility-associated C-terminal domain-containing protein n=1 Tax=Mucilaginibacter sp. TaxID=1882438 RepID=UPI00284367BE|nr:gliding motility-associated C-terminal domain-containing protein [Mucilaginibacter sp.]MDR3693119.1 gliding motility-associated C-terminal domain-containing protein [Mucilaginibacter sp.]